MDGLNFELTSPGTVRNIDYVDVCIGEKTNSETLEGFCSVVKCLMGKEIDDILLIFVGYLIY